MSSSESSDDELAQPKHQPTESAKGKGKEKESDDVRGRPKHVRVRSQSPKRRVRISREPSRSSIHQDRYFFEALMSSSEAREFRHATGCLVEEVTDEEDDEFEEIVYGEGKAALIVATKQRANTTSPPSCTYARLRMR